MDPEGTGKINQNQFIACMFLILRIRQGTLSSVPLQVPKSLWNSIQANESLSTPIVPPTSTMDKRVSLGPSIDLPWIVSESDQKQFYTYFEKLDKGKLGFITGEQGYAFFLKSKLPEEYLAIVWYVLLFYRVYIQGICRIFSNLDN